MILNDFACFPTILFIICLVGSIIWGVIIWQGKRQEENEYRVISTQNIGKDIVAYIVPYFIALINYDFADWKSIFLMVSLLLILLIIYIRADLLYINPILLLLGYNIYNITINIPSSEDKSDEQKLVVITHRKKIKMGAKISVKRIDDDLFIGEIL